MNGYLTDRSQCVYVVGCLSDTLPVETGLPQGSILGPLSWVIYSNELPETVHEEEEHTAAAEPSGDENQQLQFHTGCQPCGGLVCFADDSTYSVSTDRGPGTVP